jgi:uncharacterized membrane protein
MGTFTVWKFDSAEGAEGALSTLQRLQKQELITLHDAAIVTWPADKKKPKTRQLNNLVGAGMLGGAFWGMLFGLIFLVPLFGMVIGAAAGALGGKMGDVGIDDKFINEVKEKVTPGTSALFLLTSGAVEDKVKEEMAGSMGHAELIHTNLSNEQEAALREAFAEE